MGQITILLREADMQTVILSGNVPSPSGPSSERDRANAAVLSEAVLNVLSRAKKPLSLTELGGRVLREVVAGKKLDLYSGYKPNTYVDHNIAGCVIRLNDLGEARIEHTEEGRKVVKN